MVAEIIPPITPVPTACWLPEPAPVLVAIGNTPKDKRQRSHQYRSQALAAGVQRGV
ncbi:Uncharacterised protein [Salmonella enterica subsp. enterica]|uniref:Uncharacterized protein n=1 Tax=Salmonella enterica I TaxID=59201 RepID=A0A447TYB2_SALET|nr:Uncharacterised protein [Salmonella enterica subsp. enterica]